MKKFLAVMVAFMIATCGTVDLMTDIRKVNVPALVITGENDAINPPAEGKKVADALSASKFEVIPNAPHVAFMNETERKIVFDVIDEFLAGTHERRD